MKDPVGGAWLYGLVITFVLLFSAFLIVAMNYTKAFRIKNEVVSFIERQEGITQDAVRLINNYLRREGQGTTGRCPAGNNWRGVADLNNAIPQPTVAGTQYFYCVQKIGFNSGFAGVPDPAIYNVIVFFDLNLPLIGFVTSFNVEGQTDRIPFPSDGF